MRFFQFLFLLTAFISISTFSSCGGDDDDNTIDPEAIVGTWDLIDFTGDITTTTTVIGLSSTSEMTITGSEFDFRITFAADNTFTTEGMFLTTSLTTENGQTTMQEEEIDNLGGAESGTWTIDGNTLMLSDSTGDDPLYTILQLNNSSCDLRQETMVEIDFLGTLIATEGISNITLTK